MGIKFIKLTQGKSTIVSSSDYEHLNSFKWYYNKGYVSRNYINEDGNKRVLYMHRYVMDCPRGKQVDHINGNKLDNCRENLRITTSTGNNRNRAKSAGTTSKYKGVNWSKQNQRWLCRLKVKRKTVYLGYYDTEEEAAKVYNEAAIKYFGEFARLNIL